MEQRAQIEDKYLPNAETWVACVSDEPSGFISLLGIGRQLIAHALSLKGELSLEVYTDNQQAMTFYAGLGFEELSRRPVDDDGYPFENARLRLIG